MQKHPLEALSEQYLSEKQLSPSSLTNRIFLLDLQAYFLCSILHRCVLYVSHVSHLDFYKKQRSSW